MLADFARWRVHPGSPLVEAMAAVRMAQSAGFDDPVLVGYTPVARMNPYQSLLYRESWRHGLAVAPVTKPADFPRLTDLRRQRVAVHLHWLSFVLGSAESLSEARQAAAQFRETLTRFSDAGGQIVWTVHNVLPHDARFPEEEVALRQAVADAASVVHVMSRESLHAVWPLEIASQKVLVAPHPSYIDAYPDSITREEARYSLGLEPDEIVFVMFGAIKAYKGLGRLLEAFDAAVAASDRPLRLLVAGQPDESAAAGEFVQRCLVHPFVSIRPSKVPTEHVQYFLRAADVGLAPYERVLNSGAVMLYTTFGLPSVVPDEPPIRAALPDGTHTAFRGDDELPAALLAAGELAGPGTSECLLAHASALAPAVVSDGFARELRARLSRAR